MESYSQTYWNKISFSQKLLLILKKGYQLKDSLTLCEPLYSPRVLFYLTLLSTAFEAFEGLFDPYF